MNENIYGHKKRLNFIVAALNRYGKEKSKEAEQISVLDVGCGTGNYITIPLAQEGYMVTGIDVDADSIERARALADLPNVSFETYAPYTFPHQHFDVVVCSEVLEHVDDPCRLLSGLAACMTKESILILTTPNGFGWFEMEKFIFEKLGGRFAWERFKKFLKKMGIKRGHTAIAENEDIPHTLKDNDIHLQHFTQRKLASHFARTGLRIMQKTGGSIFAGPFTGDIFLNNARFLSWNTRAADSLPLTFLSSWYFILEKTHDNKK